MNSNDKIVAYLEYAEFGRRIIAFIIDHIIISIMVVIVNFLMLILAIEEISSDKTLHYILDVDGNIYSWVVVLYFTLLHRSKWQATVGKRLCNIHVVDKEGKRIGIFRSFFRAISHYIIGLLFLFVAIYLLVFFDMKEDNLLLWIVCIIFVSINILWYLMAFFTKERTAGHDLICKTRVVFGKPDMYKEVSGIKERPPIFIKQEEEIKNEN